MLDGSSRNIPHGIYEKKNGSRVKQERTYSNDAGLLDLSQVTFSNDAGLLDLSQVTFSNEDRKSVV